MLKNRIIAIIAGLALLLAVAGASTMVDTPGQAAAPQAVACSGNAGGGC
jgi:hypothetical protein